MLATLLSIFAVILLLLIALRLARPLPIRGSTLPETALAPATSGILARAIATAQHTHPDDSGVIALPDGNDALASRLALARAATVSIDAQYYIWHDDVSGRLLLGALYDAAERGVRVRLILDDNGIGGLDPTVATLSAHPNIAIRIFNPSTIRSPKILGFAYDFFRMNRRMHNKSFTVDGLASIIGGRNVGDEYFEIGDSNFFLDLDAIALGTVVADVRNIFDQYWNCHSVFPAEQIIRLKPDIATFRANVAAAQNSHAAQQLVKQYHVSAEDLQQGEATIEWTKVTVLADSPLKGEGKAKHDELMVYRLGDILKSATQRVDLISAYFIPGKEGRDLFTHLARGGAEVDILTNAYATTDVKAVHSGYIKYRKALLRAGVRLYELKPGQTGAAGRPQKHHITGSSSASLHAKTFAMDHASIFIGSFNFDPRSAHLNCEMGFHIASPSLADRMHNSFDQDLPYGSAQPRLDAGDHLYWIEDNCDGSVTRYDREPDTNRWDRIVMRILGWFPIERLL